MPLPYDTSYRDDWAELLMHSLEGVTTGAQ